MGRIGHVGGGLKVRWEPKREGEHVLPDRDKLFESEQMSLDFKELELEVLGIFLVKEFILFFLLRRLLINFLDLLVSYLASRAVLTASSFLSRKLFRALL